MNCDYDVPASVKCLLRQLEGMGYNWPDEQAAGMDSWPDVLLSMIPELKTMRGFKQNNPYHIHDVWQHTVAALRTAGDDPLVAWTVLFHDIGKPECYTEDENGRGHFYGHGPVSARITSQVMKRMDFDEETINQVVELVKYHDADIHVKCKSVRTWVKRLGEEAFRLLLAVRRCDISGQNPACMGERLARVDRIEALLDQMMERESRFHRKDLDIDGSDLIRIGYAPGSELGAVLSELADEVIDGLAENRKEVLLEKAARWLVKR